MKRLLVTGASGYLGWNLCQQVKSEWTTFGTRYSSSVKIPGVAIIKADLTKINELKKLFKETNPSAVIHTAALSEPNFCQENRETSYRINTEASINIAGYCSDRNIPCLFTSTDLVFDGLNPPYSEEDSPAPISIYGEHKLLAENGMKNCCGSVVICRMPLMFGAPGPTGSSFLQPLLRNMKNGIEVNLFVDEFRTPLSDKNAVEGLMIALDRCPDIVHFGGLERISRFEFGKLVMDIFNCKNARLNPCRQKEVRMSAPRPRDVSLSNKKAIKLGFQPEPLKATLRRIRNKVE